MTKDNLQVHHFHIPVMGLGFTIDSPFKVAHLGINSTVSIMEDDLIEKMRERYSRLYDKPYDKIGTDVHDFRSKRIRHYIELMNEVCTSKFENGLDGLNGSSDFERQYMALLPDDSPLRTAYNRYLENPEDPALLSQVKSLMYRGRIELNIMTKIDNPAYDSKGQPMDPIYSDAKSALRGVAEADAEVSIVFSAGFNPGLYAYCEAFSDFYPDDSGRQKKKIILKVSDFRSARIQGLFFAKKGLWVSEFRVESGLNCGGHAFVSEGSLMGPVLEEFKNNRNALTEELFRTCQNALEAKGKNPFPACPMLKISAQGGIGHSEENALLMHYYGIDSCGWGSPFLLVPEATSVDEHTLGQLANAKKEDYFLSHASPLGVPFNNFRRSTSEQQRKSRIASGRPGSPCYKKFLSFNTEFSERPICTASRKYQAKKIKSIQQEHGKSDIADTLIQEVLEKDCLCEGLSSSALQVHDIGHDYGLQAVTICPGPNLAYFSGTFTLQEMCAHIYGRGHILNKLQRDHVFINELQLNIDYLKNHFKQAGEQAAAEKYRLNLLKGIAYYKENFEAMKPWMQAEAGSFLVRLEEMGSRLVGELVS